MALLLADNVLRALRRELIAASLYSMRTGMLFTFIVEGAVIRLETVVQLILFHLPVKRFI